MIKLTSTQLRQLIHEAIVSENIQSIRDLENQMAQMLSDKVFELFTLNHDPDLSDQVHDAAKDAAIQFTQQLRHLGVL